MKRKIELSTRQKTLLCLALSFLSVLWSAAAFSQSDLPGAVITGPSKQISSGEQMQNSNNPGTGSQTEQTSKEGTAPHRSRAANGTIGPQGEGATYVTGVNTAGTVRVNNLANAEALLNILSAGFEIFSIALGSVMVICALKRRKIGKIAWGIGWILLGLATPGFFNWAFASARDAIVFS